MILYDISAFFSHLQSNKLDINGFILDLTFYELGNVLWKHVKFKVSALDKFDPLKHAVVFGGYGKAGIEGGEEIKIKIIGGVPKLVLNDQTFAPILMGKIVRAPLYYAMYLICHKVVVIT